MAATASNRKAAPAALWVGTSGYSYPEWIEAGIYPPGTKAGQMLPLYAREFPITELNYTWYQMPRAEAVERQGALVPPNFLFCAKLTRTLTHEVDAKLWPSEAEKYRRGIAPLVQSRQLRAVLIQFGASFDRSTKNRSYLGALLTALQGLPLAVEFRNASWVNDKVFAELERRHVTLVTVDEPELPGLFPSLDVVTNPEFFYVRFHGRNATGWRSGKMATQFDYDYSDGELTTWMDEKLRRLVEATKTGALFFNNHVRGQAPRNARRLMELLQKAGLLAP